MILYSKVALAWNRLACRELILRRWHLHSDPARAVLLALGFCLLLLGLPCCAVAGAVRRRALRGRGRLVGVAVAVLQV
jgi:hypothetical protein